MWFLFLALSSASLAQNKAGIAANPHKVKQGEQVTIQVKVSPAPNVAGRVDVFVAPEGSSTLNYNGGQGISPGQTSANEIGITIPVDGRLGNWKVVKVSFQPQNSPVQELSVSGSTIFEVVKRDTVLPTTADVVVK